MSVKIYHNPRCSKSRQTLAILQEKKISPDIIEYLNSPPNAAEIKQIVGMLGCRPHDIVRKKEAKELGVDLSSISEADLIARMVTDPIIIERPIVVAGDKAAMGRPPEAVLDIL